MRVVESEDMTMIQNVQRICVNSIECAVKNREKQSLFRMAMRIGRCSLFQEGGDQGTLSPMTTSLAHLQRVTPRTSSHLISSIISNYKSESIKPGTVKAYRRVIAAVQSLSQIKARPRRTTLSRDREPRRCQHPSEHRSSNNKTRAMTQVHTSQTKTTPSRPPFRKAHLRVISAPSMVSRSSSASSLDPASSLRRVPLTQMSHHQEPDF
jgi:hypothetical protein